MQHHHHLQPKFLTKRITELNIKDRISLVFKRIQRKRKQKIWQRANIRKFNIRNIGIYTNSQRFGYNIAIDSQIKTLYKLKQKIDNFTLGLFIPFYLFVIASIGLFAPIAKFIFLKTSLQSVIHLQ